MCVFLSIFERVLSVYVTVCGSDEVLKLMNRWVSVCELANEGVNEEVVE